VLPLTTSQVSTLLGKTHLSLFSRAFSVDTLKTVPEKNLIYMSVLGLENQ